MGQLNEITEKLYGDELPKDGEPEEEAADDQNEPFEGIKIPELTETNTFFEKLGLSQGQAEKLTRFYVEKVLPAFLDRSEKEWEAKQTSLQAAELKGAFDELGLGNHPDQKEVTTKSRQPVARRTQLKTWDEEAMRPDKI
jgi:hypothetical protein